MEDKEETVSELLCKAADDKMAGGWRSVANKLAYLAGAIVENSAATRDVNQREMIESLKTLADRIDAELETARNESLRRGAMVWAKANGWPDFREDEGFGEWLDRCTFKKPVDDENVPFQFGDTFKDDSGFAAELSDVLYRGNGACALNCEIDDCYIWIDEGETVKRHVSEVLGADGEPLRVGMRALYLGMPWKLVTICDLRPCGSLVGGKTAAWDEYGNWMSPQYLVDVSTVKQALAACNIDIDDLGDVA